MMFKKVVKWTISVILLIVLLCVVTVFSINSYVMITGKKRVYDIDDVPKSTYTLVFGASVYGNLVSHALSQRLDTTYDIYKNGKTDMIIVSGDHSTEDYNEVKAMRDYLIKKGIPEDNIIMDHSGLETYDSISRAQANLSPDSIIFVTQPEHLIRALYIADKLSVNAYGVACEDYSEEQQSYQRSREFLARMKAFLQCDIFKNDPEKLEKVMELVPYENFN